MFDGAFSMVGLIFFPDRAADFCEMYRVLRLSQRAVVSSISSIEGPFAQILETISAMVPGMPNATNNKPPLCDSQEFTQEMSAAGFRDVTIHTVKVIDISPTLTEFWDKTQRSAAPISLLRRKLGEESWTEVANGVISHHQKTMGSGLSKRFT
ncbi:MAG: hypothetical protein MUO76_19475 [Anaerolineaceae bacterium]|nr:hypothetical protein [Anaerolineaceae bacterium]